MLKNNFKKFVLIIALIIILLIIWVYLFVRAKSVSSQYSEQFNKLSLENIKGSYVAETSKDLRESIDKRAFLDTLFVKEGEEVSFLERIEALGVHTGLSVKVLDFKKRDKVLALSVRTQGSFSSSYYFIKLLESLPLNVTIDTLTLGQNLGDSGKEIWQGNYEITLHSFIPQTQSTQP